MSDFIHPQEVLQKGSFLQYMFVILFMDYDGRAVQTTEIYNKLANVALKVGVNIQKGQELIITAPVEATLFVNELTRQAYELGSGLVTTIYNDENNSVIRFLYSEERYLSRCPNWLNEGIAKAYKSGTARLAITGGNPNLLECIQPDKLFAANAAQMHSFKVASDLISKAWMNWNIFPFPQKAWAEAVYPNETSTVALELLWRDILYVMRIDDGDPIENWDKHNLNLQKRREFLNSLNIDRLVFTGEGTDAVVGLADNHLWAGGKTIGQNGVEFNSNIPTEEVFTTPHSKRVNGKFESTRPLVLRGRQLGKFSVIFRDGRAIQVDADNPKDADIIRRLIETDSTACMLGEVSLVPENSRISQLGRTFFNTLIDENATCHIAFGQSFAKCMRNGYALSKKDLISYGANYSSVHTDWMVGSRNVKIEAITKHNQKISLIENGEWCH